MTRRRPVQLQPEDKERFDRLHTELAAAHPELDPLWTRSRTVALLMDTFEENKKKNV